MTTEKRRYIDHDNYHFDADIDKNYVKVYRYVYITMLGLYIGVVAIVIWRGALNPFAKDKLLIFLLFIGFSIFYYLWYIYFTVVLSRMLINNTYKL